jgi:hypothetical protein
MRYYIVTHGCYVEGEKVDLQNVTLEFFGGENECVSFEEIYTDSFCNESIYKKKGYKPVFKKRREYYQMEFGNEEGETLKGCIYCCTMKQEVYNFNDGDLLLSDVIKIVTQHNDTYYPTPIYLSMLTCNINCKAKEEDDYGVTLHRKNSFHEDFFPKKMIPQIKELRKTRTKTFDLLPEKKRTRKQVFKTGDRVIYHKQLVRLEKNGKDFLLQGKRIDKTQMTLFPFHEGDYVIHRRENYQIVHLSEDRIVIEHLRDLHHETVTNFADVYKVLYPNIKLHDYVSYQSDLYRVEELSRDHRALIRNIYTQEVFPVNILDIYTVDYPIKYGDYVAYRGELYVVDEVLEDRVVIRHTQTNASLIVNIYEVYVSDGS